MNRNAVPIILSVAALVSAFSMTPKGSAVAPNGAPAPIASMWLEFTVGQNGNPQDVTVASYRGPEAGKLALEKTAMDDVRANYRTKRAPGTIMRLAVNLPLSQNPTMDPKLASGALAASQASRLP